MTLSDTDVRSRGAQLLHAEPASPLASAFVAGWIDRERFEQRFGATLSAMPAEPTTVDLSQPVTDEDSRARFALIAAMLDALVAKLDGETREEARAVLDIARQAAG